MKNLFLNKLKFVFILMMCFFVFSLISQGVIITNSNKNSQLNANRFHSTKRTQDTLKLPFFDDFTTSNVYPDKRFWTDNQVYINSHFSVSPPTFGVATFDNLDFKGKPYNGLKGDKHATSDSLTSLPLNLNFYEVGANKINYFISDSIYLSFFYQPQGLGDVLDNSDSLVLMFKNNTGLWKTAWKTLGTGLKSFKQILIPLLSSEYLYNGFQFRFINYTKNSGNMNQWHLDYIRMAKSRNRNDTSVNDVAINNIPIGPLKLYESVPYNHFTQNPSFFLMDSVRLKIFNNNFQTVNTAFGLQVLRADNSVIRNYPLGFSNRNIPLNAEFVERIENVNNLDTVTSFNFRINPGANDFTPDNFNAQGTNNLITKKVYLKNYYAYDDGTAEGGFGLDYGTLPNGPGYVAIKHNNYKADTLRGLSIFFNRSVQDVEFKEFSLHIWSKISLPPATDMSNDVVMHKLLVPTTLYTDTINGFVNFIFDTLLPLPVGEYYIGWEQNFDFMLNVGYDNNYLHEKNGGKNSYIYYNLLGNWEPVRSNVTGTLMIRPLLGKRIPKPVSIKNVVDENKVKIYPNPLTENSILYIETELSIQNITIYNSLGNLIFEINDNISEINMSQWNSGLYLVVLKDTNNNQIIKKIIKH